MQYQEVISTYDERHIEYFHNNDMLDLGLTTPLSKA